MIPTLLSRTLGRACLALVGLFLAGLAYAQTTGGMISGSVVDASTGKYLEGAEIVVEGTALRAVTARDGSFSVNGVPVGPRNVTVTYPGLETKSAPVTVASGQTASLPVRLSGSDVLMLTEFKVAGTKEGMARPSPCKNPPIKSRSSPPATNTATSPRATPPNTSSFSLASASTTTPTMLALPRFAA
jgi:hypothetical protein